MILNFDEMPALAMQHFKGGEGTLDARIHEDDAGKVLRLTLPQGASIGPHTHMGSCEVIYVLAGSGQCLDDEAEYPIRTGMCHYCPEGHCHSIVNTSAEPLILLGVVPKLS